MIKKADVILGIVLLLIGLIACIAVALAGGQGAKAVVTVDGELFGIYELSEDQTVDIDTENHHNQMIIKDGKARMTEADCPDGYCLHQYSWQGGIDSTNQRITCLPNKVLITVEGAGADPEDTDLIVG